MTTIFFHSKNIYKYLIDASTMLGIGDPRMTRQIDPCPYGV